MKNGLVGLCEQTKYKAGIVNEIAPFPSLFMCEFTYRLYDKET